MSKLALAFDTLSSVVERRAASGNANGIRAITAPGSQSEGFWGGLINGILGIGGTVLGWAWSAISAGFSWGFTSLWGMFVQAVSFVYNFNWNATDQQLDQLIENQKLLLSGMLGGTIGNLMGWVTCGIAPSVGIMYFNEALGLKLLQDVGEEALDEFLGNMNVLLRQSSLSLAQAWMINLFKSERRVLKEIALNTTAGQWLNQKMGGKLNNFLSSWGEEGTKPWSFRIAVEEAIESIENTALQEFVEEMYEEFLDACVEAGYVVAQGIDDWVVKQQMQNRNALGTERIVEITPNREAPDERIILAGNEGVLKPAITNIISQHQLIENRNIGCFTGETIRSAATKEKSPLTLLLQWSFYPSPPFYRGGKELVQCKIEGIDRSKLDWNTIKLAMGGNNGYQWGRFKAYAGLINTSETYASSAKLYGGSAQEAEDRLKALLTLSDYTIQTFSITEELKEGRRGPGRALEKETARVYPAFMTLINNQKILNEENGRTERTGTYKRSRDRIEMWTSTEPPDFDEIIQNILLSPGADI